MNRLLAFFAVCAVVISGSSSAHSEACPDTAGEIQIIDVPPGKNIRVMFFRARVEASYVEICESRDQEMKLVFAAGTEGGSWYYAITVLSESSKFYIKNYSYKLWGAVRQPWIGMKRVAVPYGYTFNWFDNTRGFNPNTIVEFCLYNNISECPQRSHARRAKNLAQMSEFAREQWLQRWMRRHGYEKSKTR